MCYLFLQCSTVSLRGLLSLSICSSTQGVMEHPGVLRPMKSIKAKRIQKQQGATNTNRRKGLGLLSLSRRMGTPNMMTSMDNFPSGLSACRQPDSVPVATEVRHSVTCIVYPHEYLDWQMADELPSSPCLSGLGVLSITQIPPKMLEGKKKKTSDGLMV